MPLKLGSSHADHAYGSLLNAFSAKTTFVLIFDDSVPKHRPKQLHILIARLLSHSNSPL
jgi:hypothetical protein